MKAALLKYIKTTSGDQLIGEAAFIVLLMSVL